MAKINSKLHNQIKMVPYAQVRMRKYMPIKLISLASTVMLAANTYIAYLFTETAGDTDHKKKQSAAAAIISLSTLAYYYITKKSYFFDIRLHYSMASTELLNLTIESYSNLMPIPGIINIASSALHAFNAVYLAFHACCGKQREQREQRAQTDAARAPLIQQTAQRTTVAQ